MSLRSALRTTRPTNDYFLVYWPEECAASVMESKKVKVGELTVGASCQAQEYTGKLAAWGDKGKVESLLEQFEEGIYHPFSSDEDSASEPPVKRRCEGKENRSQNDLAKKSVAAKKTVEKVAAKKKAVKKVAAKKTVKKVAAKSNGAGFKILSVNYGFEDEESDFSDSASVTEISPDASSSGMSLVSGSSSSSSPLASNKSSAGRPAFSDESPRGDKGRLNEAVDEIKNSNKTVVAMLQKLLDAVSKEKSTDNLWIGRSHTQTSPSTPILCDSSPPSRNSVFQSPDISQKSTSPTLNSSFHSPENLRISQTSRRTIPSISEVVWEENTAPVSNPVVSNPVANPVSSKENYKIGPHDVLAKYPKLVNLSRVGTLAAKLAREVYFTKDTLMQCTVYGCRDKPPLPRDTLMELKTFIMGVFRFNAKSPDFEGHWKSCIESINHSCAAVRKAAKVPILVPKSQDPQYVSPPYRHTTGITPEQDVTHVSESSFEYDDDYSRILF